jgi:hypothetical protein
MNKPQLPADPERRAQLQAGIRHDQEDRQRGYRDQALRMFPHICARCAREFEGKRLHELTVHHKDHDHTNNPPDGGNWELLCIYCHDHEHEKFKIAGHYEASAPARQATLPSLANPFSALDALLKSREEKEK